MAETRARGRTGAAGFASGGAAGREAWPGTGFGGGGGTGLAAAGFAGGGGGGAFGGGGGAVFTGGGGGAFAAAGAGAFAGAAGAFAAVAAAGLAAAAPEPGAAVAPSGVPQRAQNLNVAAFNVMQFGHCFGGAPWARRGELTLAEGGAASGFWAMVGRLSSSLSAAPQERQDPTSVSLRAPQRGQSMRPVL